MKSPDVTKTQVLFLLQEMELFACLTHKELFKLVQQSSVKRAEKGKVVFLRGDPSETFYVVYSGRISEYAGGLNDLEMIVKERRERDFFGEMGMLSGEAELVTAIAAVDSILIMIPREIFLSYMKKYPQMTEYLLTVYSIRLQKSAEKQITYIFLDAAARLAYQLLALDNETGNENIRISQEELAAQCGMVRQTVAKILSRWKKMEWINTGRGTLTILRRDNLEHIISLSSSDEDIIP